MTYIIALLVIAVLFLLFLVHIHAEAAGALQEMNDKLEHALEEANDRLAFSMEQNRRMIKRLEQ